ncbi:MAG: YigZ family protein [Oscillospiraceae bacterium]|nr:YigZ family protein [Candidatus Ruminococcus equi]
MNSYITLKSFASYEIVEKHSRFIAYAKPIKTEQEALDFLSEIRTKHWDARHNVYAYVLRENQLSRYSDDGEPGGTAGMPVLDVLKKSGITDAVIVVTRYFGGTLLGTGGLVRAYSTSAKLAVEQAGLKTLTECLVCTLDCSYTQYGKIPSVISQFGGVDNADFLDNVKLTFHIPIESKAELEAKLSELSAGELKVIEKSKDFFEI